jgi:hypothetical protein
MRRRLALDGSGQHGVARDSVPLGEDEDAGPMLVQARQGRHKGRPLGDRATEQTPASKCQATTETPSRAAHASIAARWASGDSFCSSFDTRM